MSYILLIWTLVGVEGYYGDRPQYDWRPLGEFASASACENAIRKLGFPSNSNRAHCIPTGKKGETK